MADEARISVSLGIRKVDSTTGIVQMDAQSRVSFMVDVNGTKGPSPGAITISLSGTDIDLSQLTLPGLVVFQNLDANNYVDVGMYEPSTGVFYPLFEIGPGEGYVMKFSRNFKEQWSGTVTGTGTDAVDNTLRGRANGAAVNLFVGAFES